MWICFSLVAVEHSFLIRKFPQKKKQGEGGNWIPFISLGAAMGVITVITDLGHIAFLPFGIDLAPLCRNRTPHELWFRSLFLHQACI